MSQKIKVCFWVILTLICTSVCYAAVDTISYSNIRNTSDFDIEYFIDNSMLPKVSVNTNEVIENLKNNEYVQTFQALCNSDDYTYITIYTSATEATTTSGKKDFNNAYKLVLSKSQLYVDSTYYNSSNGNTTYKVKSSNDSVVMLTLNWNAAGALQTDYTDTINIVNVMESPFRIGTSGYAVISSYNAGFFFSTCGILSKKDSTTYSSFFGSLEPNKINYNTYPILEEYNPDPYFVLDDIFESTVKLTNKANGEIFEIKSTLDFDATKPIGRIYAKNPELIKYVTVTKTQKNSNGNYSFANQDEIYLYKKNELVNGSEYGYLSAVAPGRSV